MPADKQLIAEKKQQLMALTDALVKAHLDEEYGELSRKLIDKMSRQKPPPFLRGEMKNWAAGVIHALGSSNFLFDPSFEPHIAAPEIADYFGVAQSTMQQKSKVIRDKFKMSPIGSPEFKTQRMQDQFRPMEEMLQQLLAAQGVMVSPMEPDGFIDDDHPVIDEYFSIMQKWETSGPTQALVTQLESCIEQDPDFYDPYVVLSQLLEEQQPEAAAVILNKGYERAIKRITAPDGSWPEVLEWGWLENRHLIRILLNKALLDWKNDQREAALDLFRKLLRSNPDDNIDARSFILAIRIGLEFDEFERKFGTEFGYDAMKLIQWFDKNFKKFPDEFDWWKKAVKYQS